MNLTPFTIPQASPIGGFYSGTGISDAVNGIFDPNLISASPWGTYSINYTYNGCSKIQNVIINGVIAGNNDTICFESLTYIPDTANPIGGIWYGNGVIDSLTGEINVQLLGSGSHSIYYTLNGCQDSILIEILPEIKANFQSTPTIPASLYLENANFTFNNTSTDAISYIWNFGDGNTLTVQNPTHQYSESGLFTVSLVAINNLGCTDTILSQIIEVLDGDLEIPNVFSPNNDGINDIFKPKVNSLRSSTIHVFDRWGNSVFVSTSSIQGWDGNAKNGSKAPEGEYFYKFEGETASGKILKRTGRFSLIR